MNPSLALVAATLLLFHNAAPAAAESVEEFYRGKRLTLYIGSSTGGGTDVYGRIVAQFIGDHIPGKPIVIPSNLPGANGLNLVNQLYNTMPRDGTALATFDRYIALQAITGSGRAKFDPARLNWIGSTNVDVSTCVTWHTTGIASLQDFIAKEIVVGSTAIYHPNILNNIFGAHLKQITGYPGGNDITLALERGEVQARCHWSWSAIIGTRPDWLRDRKINVIVQFASEKHPEMPEVPLITDLVRKDSDRAILDLIHSSQLMARPFAAPPDLPSDRLAALRDGFDATMADPAFRAAADKQQLELAPASGRRIQEVIEQVAKTPPEVIRLFGELVMPPQ